MAEPIDRRHVSEAFKRLIERGTKKPVYWEGDVPQDAEFPFSVIRAEPDEDEWAGTLADDYTSPTACYLVTCAGERADQAEALADMARRTVVQRQGGAYSVPLEGLPDAWTAARRSSEGYQGVEPVGMAPNTVWNARERFALSITPV